MCLGIADLMQHILSLLENNYSSECSLTLQLLVRAIFVLIS